MMCYRKVAFAACLIGTIFFSPAHGATTHHRIAWDDNPSSTATIGFSPDGSSVAPLVSYGFSTDESLWQTAGISNTQTFGGSLVSHFVRLTGLPADSAVYYRVCDADGCGERLWFKTAPIDNSPYVVIAGGDTRTGLSNRRAGNALVAKIRPLFVMHGGDFTDTNSAAQMTQYLTDWSLTFSDDVIDGTDYRRIYPFIPTHGNHEDNDYRTLCRVFGIDFNQDGNCTTSDTYSAISISPLLRVYTLNSQYQESGWASQAAAMNNWLDSDLSANGDSARWRFVQFHKPIFPHSTSKPDNPVLHDWWADMFYDQSVNVVFESDTHITKLTQSLAPTENGFVASPVGGTVYVGEGSWGAPARSANDPKPWTIDLASTQQFKVILVEEDTLELLTAQFNSSASTLTREQRANDPLLLPTDINWWNASSIGTKLFISQNDARRSVIGSDPDVTVITASEDTFVASLQSDINFDGHPDQLIADGSDNSYGELVSLLRFDLSSVNDCETVNSASLDLTITNSSTGTYAIYESADSNWESASATWASVNGNAVRGTQLSSFVPSSTGLTTLDLGGAIDSINAWVQGDNNGIVIASTGSTNGIDFNDSENAGGPTLHLGIDDSACNQLINNITIDGELGDWADKQLFAVDGEDISAPDNPLDWKQAWMHHDQNYLYVAYENYRSITPSWGQTLYLDTDNDPTSGYAEGMAIGADYALQAEFLYRYTGDGNSWSWEFVSQALSAATDTSFELRIDQQSIGSPAQLNLVFVGDNAAYDGGSQVDYYPDGSNNPDAALRFFSYTNAPPSNSAPIAENLQITTEASTSVAFTLEGSDINGDELSFEIIDDGNHGVVSGTPPTLSYLPDDGFTGTDWLSYRVNDAELASNLATINITVAEFVAEDFSNIADGMQLDGALTDWLDLGAYPLDPSDISGEQNPIDWREAWLAHDQQNIYLAYRFQSTDMPSVADWAINAFIDSDLDPTTGYQGESAIGADFLLQGRTLYQHTGNGPNDWNWSAISSVPGATADSGMEARIARSWLGNPTALRVIFAGDNISLGGDTMDYYPDGVYDAASPLRSFLYTLDGLSPQDDIPLISPALSGTPEFSRQSSIDNQSTGTNQSYQPSPITGGSGALSPFIATGMMFFIVTGISKRRRRKPIQPVALL